jgi:2-phosphoglycerate kinase
VLPRAALYRTNLLLDLGCKAMCKMRVVLIGGSSNVGKSTLAESLSIKLGWCRISTDSLARHSGRPWSKTRELQKHVVEYYSSLSIGELTEDMLRHYRSMELMIESLITAHATDYSAEQLIMEGSALWPEFVSTLKIDKIAAVWLTASENFFQKRIYDASQIEESTIKEKLMIQKFLERTLNYDKKMMEAINRLGLVSVNVESTSSLDELAKVCLNLLWKQLIKCDPHIIRAP